MASSLKCKQCGTPADAGIKNCEACFHDVFVPAEEPKSLAPESCPACGNLLIRRGAGCTICGAGKAVSYVRKEKDLFGGGGRSPAPTPPSPPPASPPARPAAPHMAAHVPHCSLSEVARVVFYSWLVAPIVTVLVVGLCSVIVVPLMVLLLNFLMWMFSDGNVRGVTHLIAYLPSLLCFPFVLMFFTEQFLDGVSSKHGLTVDALKARHSGILRSALVVWIIIFSCMAANEPVSEMISDQKTKSQASRLWNDVERYTSAKRLISSSGDDSIGALIKLREIRPWDNKCLERIRKEIDMIKANADAYYYAERLPELEMLLQTMEDRNIESDWVRQYRAGRYQLATVKGPKGVLHLYPDRCLMVYGDDSYTIRCGPEHVKMSHNGHAAFVPTEEILTFQQCQSIQAFYLNGRSRPFRGIQLSIPSFSSKKEWAPVVLIKGKEPGEDLTAKR